MVEKVVATPAVLELVAFLKVKYGLDLMLHQPGGFGDNSTANCCRPCWITVCADDVYFGEVGSVRFISNWRCLNTEKTRNSLLLSLKAQAARFRWKVLKAKPFTPGRASSMRRSWLNWL
jgi:uncharacterized protein (DUF779 family)